MPKKTILTAGLLGLTSLGLQFVFNRLLFFYIVNTDYATVSVISLHLSGFLVGALLAARFKRVPHINIMAAFPLLVAAAYTLTWRFGIDWLPVEVVLGLLGLSAFLVALFAGFIIARLMKLQKQESTLIIIADTAGSVVGAVIAGFWLLPHVGLECSFLVFIGFAAALSLMNVRSAAKPALAGIAVVALLLLLPAQFLKPADARQRVKGFPLASARVKDSEIVASAESPFGVISVAKIAEGQDMHMFIDNMGLCGANPDGSDLEKWSEWQIGSFPAALVAAKNSAPRIAIVGLGCGLTLTAVLRNTPPQASINMIEVNPKMPQMTKLFTSITGDSLNDPRVHLKIEDGFKHFMRGDLQPGSYDLVVVDITWMRDATLTHLFSEEFFKKVRESMAPDGIFALWNEGGDENDPVAQTVFATLQASFPYVSARAMAGNYIYFASSSRAILEALPTEDQKLTEDLRMKSAGAPLNTLDHLVLNYLIFGRKEGAYSLGRYK